nr:hypothetical protein GCM10020092_065150 [Actinoplanes digitatis]
MTMAHPNSLTVGATTVGRSGIASENWPNPVSSSSPVKISAPMPAPSSPGTSTSDAVAPPRPDASISRNAPDSGEPSSVLMAAKLPVAATAAPACAGRSRRARCAARYASPPPSATSGPSGPTTAPRPMPAVAAIAIPGRARGSGSPPGWNPSTGDSPPRPGRYRTVSPTIVPAATSGTTGHQSGVSANPSPCGRSVYAQPCTRASSLRNPYATTAIGTPRAAANTSSTT